MSTSVFRPYVEGLRALAIGLVLLYHAGLPLKGGYVGVDIFFVISGFLITSLLLREIENTGDVSLLDFYARRAKRLLPASCLVLLFTAAGVWWFAPQSKRMEFGWDIASAAAYVVNWRFADRSVNYLAEDVGRSPVLHFWSLAVEEQFYFIWPVLLLGALVLAKRTRWNVRSCAAGLLLLVFVPSLVWSVIYSKSSASLAFFVTSTRLWELGVGALLAVALPWVQRVPRRLAIGMAAVGWVFIGISVCWFGSRTAWPGAAALLPTVGTALLIASGVVDAQHPLLRVLTSRPAVALGGLSYSLYLWHWPFLVIGQDFLDFDGAGSGVMLTALSVIPAYLCHRFVENRLRSSPLLGSRPGFALSLGINLTLVGVGAGFVFPLVLNGGNDVERTQVMLASRRGRVEAYPTDFGAGRLERATAETAKRWAKRPLAEVSPDPSRAYRDVPNAYRRKCQARTPDTKARWCKSGDPKGKIDVVVVGDSKILQYHEALDAAGNALGWSIRTATKSTCPFTAARVRKGTRWYSQCEKFNRNVLSTLLKDPPDILLVSQATAKGLMPNGEQKTRSIEGMAEGLVHHWSLLERRGTQVIVLLDNPHPPPRKSVYDCVGDNEGDFDECAFPLEEGVERSAAPAQKLAAKMFPKVNVVDLTKHICPFSSCSPVIDGALVYRQSSHLTNTYAKTLAPLLTEKLKSAVRKADPKLAKY